MTGHSWLVTYTQYVLTLTQLSDSVSPHPALPRTTSHLPSTGSLQSSSVLRRLAAPIPSSPPDLAERPRRRGRPKGSKNKPQAAAPATETTSSSLLFVFGTFRGASRSGIWRGFRASCGERTGCAGERGNRQTGPESTPPVSSLYSPIGHRQ
ncbi:hypothetical protein MKEN_00750000 [Mycena kentingensis (nom. inval.)]|nr:hypothetical protein MKEN_00750000 [Mycena kentingensis (nom. inval.)]